MLLSMMLNALLNVGFANAVALYHFIGPKNLLFGCTQKLTWFQMVSLL